MSVTQPSILCAGPFEPALRELASSRRWDRVAVLTGDEFEAATNFSGRVGEACDAAAVRRYRRGAPHAEVDAIERIAEELRSFDPDVIVTGGGGSTHDAAKGIAVLLALGGHLLDHCLSYQPPNSIRTADLTGSKVALVTVPTTLAGSEANGAAGFTPRASRNKRVLSDPSLVPIAVLVDGSLAATTPPRVYLGSAMNALNHCVEGIASRRQDRVSQVMLGSALRELATATQSVADGGGIDAFERAGIASAIAGAGLSATWLGIAHAMGHVIGARYRVAHGLCHAVLAGEAVRYNALIASHLHAIAGAAIGIDSDSDALADWLDARARAWGLPTRLRDLGVPEDDIEELSVAAWHDHDTYFNPRRPAGPEEIAGVLRARW